MRALILSLALFLFPSLALAAGDCPAPGSLVTYGLDICTVTDAGCAEIDGAGSCVLTDCEDDGFTVACCDNGGNVTCSAGALAMFVEHELFTEPEPSWLDEVLAQFSWPWWAGLRAEAVVVTFDHVDGERWVAIEGEVTGGAFGSVYAAGGNYNADAGQDCAGIDHTRCFLALTLAWGNAYSAATGPAEFGMVSGDGSIRLSCFRSPDTGAVHDCAAAWATGGGWSAPVACGGPQGADLGTCVGYAWEQAH